MFKSVIEVEHVKFQSSESPYLHSELILFPAMVSFLSLLQGLSHSLQIFIEFCSGGAVDDIIVGEWMVVSHIDTTDRCA